MSYEPIEGAGWDWPTFIPLVIWFCLLLTVPALAFLILAIVIIFLWAAAYN